MDNLDALSWPVARLGEAIEELGRKRGLSPRPIQAPVPPQDVGNDPHSVGLGQWIELAATHLGLEAEPAEVAHTEVESFLCHMNAVLLPLPGANELRFLALLGGRRTVSVLTPTLSVHQVELAVIRTALFGKFEAPHVEGIDWVLNTADIPPRRRQRARSAILREQLGPRMRCCCWLLRLPPSAKVWRQVCQARLPQCLLTLLGAHTVQYALLLLAWWLVGRGALQGALEFAWLEAWVLLLLTLIPFRLLVTWLQGHVAIVAGGLLKQRLLAGALQLELDEVRHQGAGQLLGRVLEAEAVESLALSGGFLGLTAVIELLMATAIIGFGAGGRWHLLLLLGWIICCGVIGWQYVRSRRRWTERRLVLTHDLVERMVGHRTRLAQEAQERWHAGEDEAMECYLPVAQQMDRWAVLMIGLVPRGWMVLGLLGLSPALVAGQTAPVALAVSLGGILMVYRALQALSISFVHLASAAIAWRQMAPLFHAAARAEAGGAPAFAFTRSAHTREVREGHPVLEAHDLVFRYRAHSAPVLHGCNLRLCMGERLLLQGPSGEGKSTLAALLVGLRQPESGLLLLHGLDPPTLGTEGWRRRVVAAPQFHENHIFAGTFAFNLLFGRAWPPNPDDLREAEAICGELGLGELLDRMPGGIQQMVGETGWQLSHGEQSRLYIARALLQNADVVVLDESFAALDPETLQVALRCVRDRAATLLVIAHP